MPVHERRDTIKRPLHLSHLSDHVVPITDEILPRVDKRQTLSFTARGVV